MKKSMILTLAAMAASFAFATDYTWNGGGEDNLWTNPLNWGKTAATAYPKSGDRAIFPASCIAEVGIPSYAAANYIRIMTGASVTFRTTEPGAVAQIDLKTNYEFGYNDITLVLDGVFLNRNSSLTLNSGAKISLVNSANWYVSDLTMTAAESISLSGGSTMSVNKLTAGATAGLPQSISVSGASSFTARSTTSISIPVTVTGGSTFTAPALSINNASTFDIDASTLKATGEVNLTGVLNLTNKSKATFSSNLKTKPTNTYRSALTLDDSSLTVSGTLYLSEAAAGGARLTFKGANPVMKVVGVVCGYNNSGATQPMMLNFFVPEGGFQDTPFQNTSTTKMFYNQNNSPSRTFQINVTNESPAFAAGTLTTCPLIAARAGINRYSTLPNLAISPGAALAYSNLTSTAAASSDESAQVLWATLGEGAPATPVTEKSTAFDGTSLSVARNVVTARGYAASVSATAASTVAELYEGTANSKASMELVGSATVTRPFSDEILFTFTADPDEGEVTHYFYVRLVDKDAEGNVVSTSETSIYNATTRDTTTYTWQAVDGVWDGDWTDPAHWKTDVATQKGYPYTASSTAVFPGGHAIVVTNSCANTVGTLNLTADNADVTFKGGPDGTNVVLGVSTLLLRGADAKLTLDSAYMGVANDATLGRVCLVLQNAARYYGDAKLVHESGGLIHLMGHSYMNLSYMRMSNNGTRLVIDDSTVYLRGDLEYAESDKSSYYGGKTTFRGAAPILLFAAGKCPSLRVNGSTATDWEFEVPTGGYASAPVRTANATVDFPGKYKSGRLRFTVSDDSPCFGDVATFDTPLVAWNGTKSILTAHVTTNAIAGPDSADCGFLYGTGATAGAYGWAAMGAFSGTAKTIGVHIAASAHDDRVTVSTDNGAAVTGCSPAYGVHDGYAAGTAYTFTAPAAETVDGVRYRATGCTVTTYAAGSLSTVESVAEHAGATLEYEFAGKPIEIVWHFAIDYSVAATAVNDAGGAVAASGDGHMSAASPVTLTASTATDGMEFQYWYGDVPYANRFDNPLTLAADTAAEVYAFFGATAANGAARLSSGGNGAANWFSTATWTGGVIPGTNDTAVLVGTYEAGSVNQGANGRRVFAPSYIGVGNLVVTNAILLVNVPTSSGFTRDTADGYGNQAYAPLGASDKVRTEPVGLDVFGDVLLENRNKAKNNNAGVIFVGGSGQKANSRVFIGGDLAVSNGCLFVSAGVVPDYSAFYPLKSGSGPSYFADYTNRVELYKGGNWVKVGGRTTLATPTTVNYQNMLQVANDYVTGAAVHLDLGDVFVGEGAAITAWASGYGKYTYNDKIYTMCPGGSFLGDNSSGGSYGGRGGTEVENSAAYTTHIATYGSEVAPIHPGSPVPGNGTRGGGTIRLDCATLELNGMLNAHGTLSGAGGNKGAAAGGGIWVNCASFVPGDNCMVSVRGGTWGGSSTAGGGGGRASICVGLSDGQMDGLFANDTAEGITVSPLADVLTTRFSADGGAGGGTRHGGEPGTGVYIINSAGRSVLTVSGDPGNYGSPTPAYGSDAYDTGSEIALAAPEEAYVADDNRSRRVASGYTVTNASGTVLAQSAGTSGSFTINEDAWLIWDITTLQHAIAIGATVGGAVTTNAICDASSVWQDDGAALSFTAVPDPGYVFRGWFGEVEREWMDSAQIAFEADCGRTITALFEPAAAGARVWTGEGDGASWLDPANWSPAGLPGIAEAVTIPKGANVTASLCAQLEVGSLTVEYGAALTVRRLLTTHTTRGTLPADATRLDKLPTSLLVNGDLVVGGTLTMGFRNSYSQFDLAVAGNLVVETNATVNLYAGYAALKDTSPDGWAEGGGRVCVRGAMTIADKASVKPYCDCIWGAPVVFEVGSARIDAGGSVNAYAAGWAKTTLNALTYGGSPNRRDWSTWGYAGGTYAGIGGYSDTHTPSSTTYGSPYAPYMPGSPGMNSDSYYGGGAIRIHAEGDFVLDGTLNANGYYPSNAGSGGSIWITAGRYRSGANAVVTAAGGDRTGNSGAGGGGRVCLAQGLTDEQIGQLYETGTCDKFAKLTVIDLMDAEAERPARLGGTVTARGGTNPRTTNDRRHYGTDGTAVWLAAQPAGTILFLQ